ncbi:MAG: hypothetical protein SXG53_14825 [Pseudomonadota bacterium]|nr:hypothetical protein [Pseudomonadota bacterium]
MIIGGIRLRISTAQGEFGFQFEFERNLNIVRGGNSSGKSTFFNSLLYGLGIEELIGGRGERTLPYAVKEYIEHQGSRVNVDTSEVIVEIENFSGQIITLRRAIRDKDRNTKLVEVFECSHLRRGETLDRATPKYLHDPGSAQKDEGFFRFFERFLQLQLPRVATTSGGETKLYPQAVFAALAVEQKRGWTDYIANIPFFGIRDARSRVVEYLLGLEVFESTSQLNRLNAESRELEVAWHDLTGELKRNTLSAGVILENVPSKPARDFDGSHVQLLKHSGDSLVSIHDFIGGLRVEYSQLQEQINQGHRPDGRESLRRIEDVLEELERLSQLHEQASSSLTIQRSSLREYEQLLREAREDLDRNKTAAKLRSLGAQNGLAIAANRCPTCHQHVADTLLTGVVTGPQMDLDTNIGYLQSQVRMLERQVAGARDTLSRNESAVADLARQVATKHDLLTAMRGDARSGATESRATLRRQLQIEAEIERLEQLQQSTERALPALQVLAQRLTANLSARENLPRDYYSNNDQDRISLFEKNFRSNAQSFGYESAQISQIRVNHDTLVPTLADLELRQISKADIKSDSSASDFVRLIWSYLLSLYQTSAHRTINGNHPSILLMDEPGQHSMAEDSQHALLKQLSSEKKLQSIVAASFDESESVFRRATDGVPHKLFRWDGKLIRPL